MAKHFWDDRIIPFLHYGDGPKAYTCVPKHIAVQLQLMHSIIQNYNSKRCLKIDDVGHLGDLVG